jgi:pyrroline-5-carboxylate reductase
MMQGFRLRRREPMSPSPTVLPPVAFIGGGNMARALIGGMVRGGASPGDIHVSEPHAPNRDSLAAEFSVVTTEDNAEAASRAAVWVLATKPQVLRGVCEALASLAQSQQPLVVSIAAGITSAQIDRWLGGGIAVVRTMPNTPALLGAGVTGLYATAATSSDQRALADRLLQPAGETVWIDDEILMDAVTAASGSGPAYVFLLAEAMQAAAEAEGLPAEAARTLVVETIAGAARMLRESGESATTLRQRVTSPNGTTQAALDAFAAGGFAALVATAVHAARIRGAELSAAND